MREVPRIKEIKTTEHLPAQETEITMKETRMTSSLARLPPELFEHVARYVDGRDLSSIRLASKDCAAKVLRTYSQAFFSELNVSLNSESGLRNALKRADHPVFGLATRGVFMWIDEHRPGCSQCKVLYDTQEWIRRRGLDVELLETLFRRLAKLGRVREMTMRSTALTAPKWKAEERKHDPKECLAEPPMRDPRPFGLVMEALRASGLSVRSFAMETPTWSLPLQRLSEKELAACRFALEGVESLRLDVWVDVPNVSKAHGFMQTIASLPNLSNLSMRGRDQSDNDGSQFLGFDASDFPDPMAVARSFFSAEFLQLRTLGLSGMAFFSSEMAEFMRRHDGLRTVRLKNPWFVGTREFDTRYHFPSNIQKSLQAVTGKEDIRMEMDGGWEFWGWNANREWVGR